MPAAAYRNSVKAPIEQKVKVKQLKYTDTCQIIVSVVAVVSLIIIVNYRPFTSMAESIIAENTATDTVTALLDLYLVLDLEQRSRELCNEYSYLNNFVCVLTTSADELNLFEHGLITEYLEFGFPLHSGWKF